MLVNIIGFIKWQLVSIREVPVTTMDTLRTAAACAQVSVTLNTLNYSFPYQAKVHIGVVGQRLAHDEGDIRKGLRVDLHQGPEETEGKDHYQHHNLFYGLVSGVYELCRFVCFITRSTLWLLANATQGKSNHKM